MRLRETAMFNDVAVIFDIDGVLVDSYHAHFRSWQTLSAEAGFHHSEADFVSSFGRTSHEILAELGRDWTPGQIAELVERKEAIYRRSIAERFPVMPGALELIDSLIAAGFRLAVGSSGPPANVALSIEKLGRQGCFAAQVSGADVTRGKPDPEVFLLAAERLGLSPRRCVVIEDASAGIAAANAARMVAIALVSQGHTRSEYVDADLMVDRLEQLSPAGIRQWINDNRD